MLKRLFNIFSPKKEETPVIPRKLSTEEIVSLQATALQAAANGIVITDIDGLIQWINPAFTKLTGYSSDEAVGKSTSMLNSSKQDKSFYQNLWNTILAGKMWHGEMIERRKDGSLYEEEQTITPVKDKSGKIIHFISIKQDVTDRKKLEAELVSKNTDLVRRGKKQDETRNALLNVMEDLEAAKATIEFEQVRDEAILASIGDGLVVVDRDMHIILLNHSAEVATGWRSQELLGKVWQEVIELATEDGKRVSLDKSPLFLAIRAGKTTTTTTTTTYVYTRKDKTKFPVAITVSPVKLKGNIIGAIVVFRDVTHEREVDRAKSEFISLTSHQLRTPLTSMKWFGEMLLSGDAGKLKKEQEEYVQNIYNSNERMIALINSLLNISRIESGRLMVEPHPTDLGKLVKAVIAELRVKMKEKKQTIIVSIHPQLPKINIDPKLVRNIYLNLLTNAIKYTPEQGELSVFISKKGDQIISQVSDTGVGIPQKEQGRVFSKFFRGENIIKIETDGSGLGLYLVKAIVESSNGKIWFSSPGGSALGGESTPKGTSFWFSLPLSGVPAKKGEVTVES